MRKRWLIALAAGMAQSTLLEVPAMEMDYQRQAIDLSGPWQVQVEMIDTPAQQPAQLSASDWADVQVPGPLIKEGEPGQYPQVRCVWARRTFQLTQAQARQGAVLKWGGMRFGATIYVNGERVGQRVPVGPYTLLLRPDILQQGDNVLLLRVLGWGGIPRGEAGFPLFPTGSATQGWGGKNPCIPEGIWMEFYDRAYIERALALPDIEGRHVTFRVDLTSSQPLPRNVRVEAIVRDTESGETVGQVTQEVSALTVPALISVPMSSVKPWTPQTPHLYEAKLTASADGKQCDRVTFRFGMRSIEVIDGHYRLNGQPLWLRGSNLVYEWLWGDVFKGKEKAYLVDEARRMNLNCFRTHTMPPPADWTNVCDEYGTMILAELPVLYNHMDFKFTDSELATFNAHALDDAEQWISKLWNHPAVILWVLTNESPGFNEAFESGEYWQFVKHLDPTRPAMRAGPGISRAGTPEVYDIHTCGNFAGGVEGELLRTARMEAGHKDPRRTLSNSEYMNIFGKHTERWLGSPNHPDAQLVFAEFALEHTEAMRRAPFDCILPYMFAGWTGLRKENLWRDDYPTPIAAALHSSMAPVLASLELFDRNYVAGQKLAIPVQLINELPTDVPATIDYYLTPRDPLFVPDEDALEAAVWHERRQWNFRANSNERDEVTITVPMAVGEYYLAAVVRRPGESAVVSQRVVRSIAHLPAGDMLRKQRVVVLGGDPIARWTLRGLGLEYLPHWTQDGQSPDVVVVWDGRKVRAEDRERTAEIVEWVRHGGRLVVLDQETWDWPQLADFKLSEQSNGVTGISSRAFFYTEGAAHPAFAGLPAETFKRWNGLLGRVANRYFADPLPQGATKLMWMENPTEPVMVSIPLGEGEILLCQLQLKQRVAPDSEQYDPAAERLFVNLLSTESQAPVAEATTPTARAAASK